MVTRKIDHRYPQIIHMHALERNVSILTCSIYNCRQSAYDWEKCCCEIASRNDKPN